jgi:hypothetical protein
MTPKQALRFVKIRGIVLESARSSLPNLAQTIAGQPISRSWWKHPKSNAIFLCSRAIRQSTDVLVCRLVSGKVTYLHRRLWPALVRLADRFDRDRLAAIREIHTPSGKHKVEVTPYPDWLPAEVVGAAANLTAEDAETLLPISVKPKKYELGSDLQIREKADTLKSRKR